MSTQILKVKKKKNITFGAHVRTESWLTTMWTFTRSAVANLAAETMSANV